MGSVSYVFWKEFVLCIVPWGILCLSSVSIPFVSILFPWWASVGSGVFLSVCSIYFVKSS